MPKTVRVHSMFIASVIIRMNKNVSLVTMNAEDLWFNIIPHILPGLQSFPNWRSRESLGLEGRGVCLRRTCFPTSMNHKYNHPNCILSGEVTKTPISGPNGFLVLWVNATDMSLNKCPQKAPSQCHNLGQSGCRGAFLRTQHKTKELTLFSLPGPLL